MTPPPPPKPSYRSFAYGVALFAALACVYLLVYRGHPLSIDEISLFDSVESFTQHGTLARTTEFYRAPAIAEDGSPFLPPLYEPLQIVAASPFYLLAQASGQFGQFQAVYLLNAVVTALTAVSVYAIALRHGYSNRTALAGGLLFGTATLALPYSRWLFREPLMGLFALWAYASAFDIRQRMQRRQPIVRMAAALVVATLAMILTKQAALLFVPGLAVCLTPPLKSARRFLPVLALLAGAVLVFVVAIAIINPDFGDDRYNVLRWLNPANLGLSHMVESALGYQISPARSFWLYSPLLLLGFAGIARLLKREEKWLVFGVVLTFLLSSAAYGALRLGAYWNGGWGWGPRYMLPLVPLWMLFLLPVIETIWHAPRWQRATFAALAAASIGMQIIGIAVPYTDFYNRFYLEAPAETRWLAENWSWQNTAIGYHLQHFSLTTFDSAWRFADPLHVVPLALLAVAALSLAFGRSVARRPARLILAGGMALLMIVAAGALLGMSVLRHDARYIGNRQDVLDLVRQLNADVRRDDTILLSGSEYMVLFMNWFTAGAHFIAVPDDATMPPAFEAEFEDTAGPEVRNAIDWAALNGDVVWLIMSPSSYDPAHPQRYKRYLAAIAYPIDERAVSPFAVAARFATGRGAAFDERRFPQPPTFGGQLTLSAASLPGDLTFDAGDAVPFSLEWTSTAPQPGRLHVSVQLLDADGGLAAQRDTPLGATGTASEPGPVQVSTEHHAIALPNGLAPGDYRLYVIVYRPETLERLPVAGGELDAEPDALLLARIQVR